MHINMVQDFIAEVDSPELLERYLRLAMTTALGSHQELAVKVVDDPASVPPRLSSDKTLALPVILVGGWFRPQGVKANSYFDGSKPWQTFETVDAAVEHVREILSNRFNGWKKIFRDKFGKGYNLDFNEHDGTVGVGYRLQTCHCFPQQLSISLVHMYYGK